MTQTNKPLLAGIAADLKAGYTVDIFFIDDDMKDHLFEEVVYAYANSEGDMNIGTESVSVLVMSDQEIIYQIS